MWKGYRSTWRFSSCEARSQPRHFQIRLFSDQLCCPYVVQAGLRRLFLYVVYFSELMPVVLTSQPSAVSLVDMRLCVFSAALLVSLTIVGCMRREGRNADCKWPAEISGRSADARHLSADAEFAEDLAIRYADTHYGLRTRGYVSGEVYGAARDRCMASLFEQIAKEHRVPVGLVSGALGRNRGRIDLAINLPYVLLYGLAAIAVARFIWRKYPPTEHGWIPGAIMALFLSLVIAALSMMLGEIWSWVAESYRIGNDHMSYRVQRLWWVRHRTEHFAGAVTAFWLAVAAIGLRTRSHEPSSPDRAPQPMR